MLPLLITISVIAAVIFLFGGIYLLIGPDAGVEDRLDLSSGRSVEQVNSISQRVNERLNDGQYASKLSKEIAQAGLNITPAEFIMINVGLTAASLLLGFFFTQTFISGVALAILTSMAPRVWLRRQRTKRIASFQEQLPDVLSLIVGSLRAGYGLVQAMKLVSQEMPAPSSEEYGRVVDEISLGFSLQQALDHLVERMESDDLMMVVTAINIQNEVGGNLGNILETIVVTIRDRVKLQGDVRSMTSMQRATGYMLAAMPLILGLVLMVINPTYMTPLFSFPWILIPVGAVVSMSIGLVLMNKMTAIDI